MNATVSTLPREVIKRSGERAPFDAFKIRSALERAGAATGEFDADEAALLTAQAGKVLIHRFHGQAPGIEQIQDVVEHTLIAATKGGSLTAYRRLYEMHLALVYGLACRAG